MNVFTKFAQTISNLLTAADTTINMVNRVVNSGDQYLQTVERHAEDFNYESKIISAKRREQLLVKFRTLSDEELEILKKANKGSLFDELTNEPQQASN